MDFFEEPTDPNGITSSKTKRIHRSVEDVTRQSGSVSVGFSTTNLWISRIIRFFTRAPISHAWISYYDDRWSDLSMIVQSESFGFFQIPFVRWKRKNKLVVEFKLAMQTETYTALKRLFQHLGDKYNWKAALWTGLKAWLSKWRTVKFRLGKTPGRMMCAESVVHYMQDAHYVCVLEMDPQMTSPWELCKALYVARTEAHVVFMTPKVRRLLEKETA